MNPFHALFAMCHAFAAVVALVVVAASVGGAVHHVQRLDDPRWRR